MSGTEFVHLALSFRDTACGTAEDFIDMTQDRSNATCPACVAELNSVHYDITIPDETELPWTLPGGAA